MSIDVCSEIFTVDGVEFGIELTADARGLTACRLEEKPATVRQTSSNPHLREAVQQLHCYFAGDIPEFSIKLAPDGTTFQQDVWQVTSQIPSREVRSYAWIANEIGNPKAVRAVAQALGANPLLLFVPCHRVVRSDGSLGGFSCGIEWKIMLLRHEGINFDDRQLSLAL